MKMFFDSSAFEGSFFMAVGVCFIGVALDPLFDH